MWDQQKRLWLIWPDLNISLNSKSLYSISLQILLLLSVITFGALVSFGIADIGKKSNSCSKIEPKSSSSNDGTSSSKVFDRFPSFGLLMAVEASLKSKNDGSFSTNFSSVVSNLPSLWVHAGFQLSKKAFWRDLDGKVVLLTYLISLLKSINVSQFDSDSFGMTSS